MTLAILILLLGSAICIGLAIVIVEGEEADNRIYPLTPDDQALREHYLRADAFKLQELRRDRDKLRRDWDAYHRALVVHRGRLADEEDVA